MSQLPFNSSWLAMSGWILRITFFFSFLFSLFILKAQNVGINTLDPKAGLHVVSDNGILATGILNQGTVQDSGQGTRMMWIPYRGAFRTGVINFEGTGLYTHRWDPDSIGYYSFAGGVNTRASGQSSFSYGNRNVASGEFSTALGGFENFASGYYSFATGNGNRAPSAFETVVGSFGSLYTPNDIQNWDSNDRVFSVGIGYDINNRNNAMTILKNGNVGIGTDQPQERLHLVGNAIIDGGNLLFRNTGHSIRIGDHAGQIDDLTDNSNIFIGDSTGQYIITGKDNIGIGREVMEYGNGSNNIAIGRYSMYYNDTGFENLAIGSEAMENNISGHSNIALGLLGLSNNTTGSFNLGIGSAALKDNVSGIGNVGLGTEAFRNITMGSGNVGVGAYSGVGYTGSNNTFLGYATGQYGDGNNNVFIGKDVGKELFVDNKLFIDNQETTTPLIYGDFQNNKVFINDSLGCKYLQLTNGAADTYILQSDAAGNGSWSAPSSIFSDDWTSSGNNIYNNNSQNVGIGTSTPTEKVHVVGNLNLESGRLTFLNNQNSTYVGFNAGLSDDMGFLNASTFVGYKSGMATTTGSENSALGANSLLNNLTGHNNVAVGNASLRSNISGYGNSVMGYGAMDGGTTAFSNVAFGYYTGNHWNGHENAGIGVQAGENNYTGNANTFLGTFAGQNSTGSSNVFIGYASGQNETGNSKLYIANSSTTTPLIYGDFPSKKIVINDSLSAKFVEVNSGRLSFLNTGQSIFIGKNAGLADDHTANNNVMIGEDAGKANISGENNIAIGTSALDGGTTVNNNIAIGKDALGGASLTGQTNMAIGNQSLSVNTSGESNVAIGQNSLGANTSGNKNVSIGQYSMDANQGGSFNAAMGYDALGSVISGEGNVAIGYKSGENANGINNTFLGSTAGDQTVSGNYNTIVGNAAGFNNIAGSSNVFLGYLAGYNETGSDKLYISNSNTSSPLIYGDFAAHEITINDSLTVNKELGVGTSTPNSTLEVNGTVAAKFKTPLAAGTDNPDGTGMVWRYTSGTGTITLPAASTCANRMYVIINQTGTTRTISSYRDLTTTPQTTISSSVALWIMSDGTNWYQIK